MAEKYVEKIKSASSGEIYTIRDANIDTKQDLLVSGTNIKTINNQSILGSGNIDIQGGTGAVESVNNKTGKVTLTASDVGAATEAQGAKADTAVQPAAIADMETQTHASSTYQTKLTSANAGTNVTITEESGVVKISAAGGSGGASTFAELQGQPTDNANLAAALNAKQETLVSGTNIKSINNTSLLGEGNVEVLTSSDVGTMAAEDKTDYFTKTEVTDGFLPSNLGPENTGKVLKIDNVGEVIAAEVAGATVDTEISAISTNPLQNKAIYDSLYEPSEMPYDSQSETKRAISSTDGSIITVAASNYIVNIYNNIDPTLMYWIDAYAYGSEYAYCGFYKIENETEVCLGLVQFKSAAQRRIQDELLTVPAGTTIIKVAGQTNGNYASLKTRYASIGLLKDRCTSLETRTTDLETLTHTLDLRTDVLNTVDVATDDTIINEMFSVTYPRTLTKDDFTVVGYYNNTDTTMKTQYAYHSVPLIPVKPGQMIYWHNWILPAYAQACCLYDNDGLPYNGTNARKDYTSLTTHDTTTGEFSLLIPEGCTQIGFSLADSAFATLEGTIVASELSYNFSDNAVDQIEEIIQTTPVTTQPVGLDYGVYYQRGAYGKSFDYSKKLCILAGGQSNAAGRAPFVRFPFDLCGETGTPTSPFTLPNVQFLGATEDFGTSASSFSDAKITKKNETESSDNSWAFDSVTYACMTNASYGNQADIHVVKRAVGGTSIDVEGATSMHWTADYKDLTGSNSLLRALEGYIRTAESLQSSGYEIRAMVWHQGEGDAGSQGPANRYYANFKKMITYIRGIVGNPFLPFYCGTISDNNHADAYKNIVNAAINQIAAEDQHVRVVDMSGAALEDSWHFDYKACIYFGKAVYNMMLEDGVIQSGTPIDNPLPDNWTSNS